MEHGHSQHRSQTSSRGRWVFLAFVIMGGALLFTEHRAHVLGILPWLFILACPLMHIFMHGGHGHGHGGSRDRQQSTREVTRQGRSDTGKRG